MKLKKVVKLLNAKVITGNDRLEEEVKFGFASDLLSDVLTTDTDYLLLITGMANLQAIRTADMAEITCIAFVRDKKMTHEMIDLASENNLVTIESPYSMFHAVAELHDNGLKPVF
jgi:predicted transcriptional regulator